MIRKVPFVPGEYYHIYNRGVDKRAIFLDNRDYRRFIKLLFFCNSLVMVDMRKLGRRLSKGETFANFIDERGATLVDIGAFCLMPNHFHLLVHEKIDGGITIFLRKLCTAYSMYFNTKNGRSGSLFEKVFLAEHADHDQYLKYLFSYIHLNSAKLVDSRWRKNKLKNMEKMRFFIEDYEFSSYRNYLGEEENMEILHKPAFPDYFMEKGIRAEIGEWLGYDPNRAKVSPLL